MKIAVVALTRGGATLGEELAEKLAAGLYIQAKYGENITYPRVRMFSPRFEDRVAEIFTLYDGFVFIMATGIVVRTIAPLLRSKLVDPGVVVVDEKGRYAISLLSGHLGGANELCLRVANAINAEAVITTATDVNELVAVDVIARNNDCIIENPREIKPFNTALLEGEQVAILTPFPIRGTAKCLVHNPYIPHAYNVVIDSDTTPRSSGKTINLRPRHLVLGIGCRRGTSLEAIKNAVHDLFSRHHLSTLSIGTVASVDLKADEEALFAFCDEQRVPFVTFSGEELAAVEDRFMTSSFVKAITGAGNVCEAASFLAAGPSARKLIEKTVYPGVTVAVFARDYEVELDLLIRGGAR